jgi:hypothetical protein
MENYVMIKELKMYWRLRPYIKKIKEQLKMKFSVNMIIQILATIAQAMNQISDLFGPGNREAIVLVVGIIQAVVALMAHYKNPDGTPASTPYIKPSTIPSIKALFIPLILFPFFAFHAQAQESGRFAAVGLSTGSDETKSISGWGAIGFPISEKVISYTDIDISVVKNTTLQEVLKNQGLQYVVRTGLAYRVFDINKQFSVWGLGDAGLAAGGPVGMASPTPISGSFAGGGFLRWSMGKVDALLILQVQKNAATGREFIPRIGIKVKL